MIGVASRDVFAQKGAHFDRKGVIKVEDKPQSEQTQETRENEPLFSRLPRKKKMRYTHRAGH